MCKKPNHYRNTVLVSGIDPQALWERISDTMILVDEDQYLTAEYSEDEFTEVTWDDVINLPKSNDEG